MSPDKKIPARSFYWQHMFSGVIRWHNKEIMNPNTFRMQAFLNLTYVSLCKNTLEIICLDFIAMSQNTHIIKLSPYKKNIPIWKSLENYWKDYYLQKTIGKWALCSAQLTVNHAWTSIAWIEMTHCYQSPTLAKLQQSLEEKKTL